MINKTKFLKYAALLRGITPTNPNMHNEKLRGVFESLGFINVQTVISSGNVLFESPIKKSKELEEIIEDAIAKNLGFTSTTIIRSKNDLQSLVDSNPFTFLEDAPTSRLNVTFLKKPAKTNLNFPYYGENNSYELLGIYDRAICSVIDLSGTTKTPDLMSWLEKHFGKEITTRTWKTVNRIIKKNGVTKRTLNTRNVSLFIERRFMEVGLKTVIYPVTDLEKAKQLFSELLKIEPYADHPYYVAFRIGDQEIGLDPNGHKSGLTCYYNVENIRVSLRSLLDGGAEVIQEIKDVGGGKLIASVKDPDGNIIGLTQSP